ncbi:hypothetical protein HAX54_052719 [Datura stramonium]|uniref:Uncharacterized protein n=1 Tax=Datura stramonium TaxID=4076 RepID=A0ABS8SZC3_DATST|nr:hypothetical protein [Datura stramonium]
MDVEALFHSCFSMDKKPNIFELIQAAVTVGAWKRESHGKTNSAKQSGKGGADAEIKNMNTTVISKNCNGGGSTRKKHKRPEEFQQSDEDGDDKQLTAKPCSVEGVSRNAAIKRVQIPHHHHHDKQCFGQKAAKKQSNCNIVAITQTTTED